MLKVPVAHKITTNEEKVTEIFTKQFEKILTKEDKKIMSNLEQQCISRTLQILNYRPDKI